MPHSSKMDSFSNTVILADVGDDPARNELYDDIYNSLTKKGIRLKGLLAGLGNQEKDKKRDVSFEVSSINDLIRSDIIFTKTARNQILQSYEHPSVIEAAKLFELNTRRSPKDALEVAATFKYEAELYLRREKPFACIMWHQFNSMNIILGDLCDSFGIKKYYMEHGLLPGSVNIESDGQMAESEIHQNSTNFNQQAVSANDVREAQRYIDTIVEKNVNRKPRGDQINNALNVTYLKSIGKPIVLYAGQNDPKSGILPSGSARSQIHSPYFNDTFDGLEELSRVCLENDMILLYKPHPSVGHYEKNNNFDFDSNSHVYQIPLSVDFLQCVDIADVFVTIVSTGAYQALFRDKPCVILGNMPLSNSGAVYQISDRASLTEELVRACADGITKKQKEALLTHTARVMKYSVYQYIEEYVEFFKLTTADFAGCARVEADARGIGCENYVNNIGIIKTHFEGKEQLVSSADEFSKFFITSYSHDIHSVEVTDTLEAQTVSKYLNKDVVSINSNTVFDDRIPIFIVSRPLHKRMASLYLSANYDAYIIDISTIAEHLVLAEIEHKLSLYTAKHNCVLIMPIDDSGLIGWASEVSRINSMLLVGMVFGIFNPELLCVDGMTKNTVSMMDVAKRCDWVFSPGMSDLSYQEDINVGYSGYWESKTETVEPTTDVLVYADFVHYNKRHRATDYIKGWLDKIIKNAKRKGLSIQVYFGEEDAAVANELGYEVLSHGMCIEKIIEAGIVVTPFSDMHFVAKLHGRGAIVFDYTSTNILTLDRGKRLSGAYIRKPDILRQLFAGYVATEKRERATQHASKILASTGRDSIATFNKMLPHISANPNKLDMQTVEEDNFAGHITMFTVMPDWGYSGGRYHALILAEALAAKNYQVTLVTTASPFFKDDFENFTHHQNIKWHIINKFENLIIERLNRADLVFVIPDFAPASHMYLAALEYAYEKNAHIVQLNFESPNWFNSMAVVPRDVEKWKFWKSLSKFSSMILSTTQESSKFAEDFYYDNSFQDRYQHLYAAINSIEAEQYCSIEEKEKRVIFFLPRATLSEHKGWKSIIQMFGPDFEGHTLVLLCSQNSLDEELSINLKEASELYNFSIEFKIQLNDKQKFYEISRACLMVFPSEFEGYGYPPVEALCSGTPCVAFDIPVLRETCQDKLIYAPPGDWATLRELVNGALKDEVRLTQQHVDRGYEIASFENFAVSAETLVSNLLQKETLWTSKYSDKNSFYLDVYGEFVKEEYWGDKLDCPATYRAVDTITNQLEGIYNSRHLPIDKIDDNERVLIFVPSIKTLTNKSLPCSTMTLINLIGQMNRPIDIVVGSINYKSVIIEGLPANCRVIPIGTTICNSFKQYAVFLLQRLFGQYSYDKIISVDDFLVKEYLFLTKDKNSNHALFKSEDAKLILDNTIYETPHTPLLALDRKKWFSSSRRHKSVAIFCNLDNYQEIISYMDAVLDTSKYHVDFHLFGTYSEEYAVAFEGYNLTLNRNNDFSSLVNNMTQCVCFVYLPTDTEASNTVNYLIDFAILLGIPEVSYDKDLLTAAAGTHKFIQNQKYWAKLRKEAYNNLLSKNASDQRFGQIKGLFKSEQIRVNTTPIKDVVLAKIDFLFSEHKDNDLWAETSAYFCWDNYRMHIDKCELEVAFVYLMRLYGLHTDNIALAMLVVKTSVLVGKEDIALLVLESLSGLYPAESWFTEQYVDVASSTLSISNRAEYLLQALAISKPNERLLLKAANLLKHMPELRETLNVVEHRLSLFSQFEGK